MTADIVVSADALAGAAGRFAAVASQLADVDIADSVAAAGTGLPGTRTAAAVGALAVRLSAGLAAYAAGVNGLARGTVEAQQTYRDVDEHVVDEIMQVTGNG